MVQGVHGGPVGSTVITGPPANTITTAHVLTGPGPGGGLGPTTQLILHPAGGRHGISLTPTNPAHRASTGENSTVAFTSSCAITIMYFAWYHQFVNRPDLPAQSVLYLMRNPNIPLLISQGKIYYGAMDSQISRPMYFHVHIVFIFRFYNQSFFTRNPNSA